MRELFSIGHTPDPAPLHLHGIRPFSVIRTDTGPWRQRRRTWLDTGLDSRRGREHVSTFNLSHASGADIFGHIGGLSTFDPVLAEAAYTWFCPPTGRVLDPFAGGSVRGLVAANLGYQYTGIDLSGEQIAANRDQADDWAARDLLVGTVTWLHGDAAELLPTLPVSGYDYVLTCPPYHNLERYSDHPGDLSAMRWPKFAAAYRAIIAATVDRLAPDRFATWVVGEVRNSGGMLRGLIPLTIDAHEQAGARFYNDAVLINPIGSAA
ncbi:MAG TPA: class I SAM-dependent methyltransferase, partial [Catenuloplanes sp.]